MKNYFEIAKLYFRELEGRHLYPSNRSIWYWAWIVATVWWFIALVYFAFYDHSMQTASLPVIIMVPELVWLAVTFKIAEWKKGRLIESTNRRYGTQFDSASKCRQYLLSVIVGVQPPQFLRILKEIDDLVALRQKFQKRADLMASEFWKNIYDRDSKARLMTMMIAIVSLIVALSVRSDATLNTLFDAYSDPGFRTLLALIAILAVILFFTLIGLRIFISTAMDVFVFWYLKIFSETAFTGWLLSYLVRDLIEFHDSHLVLNHSEVDANR